MSARAKITAFGLMTLVISLVPVIGIWALSHTSVVANATGPTSIIAVLRGDTLNDLARLMRPMTYSIPSAPPGNKSLKLRDAIYTGASSGRARLLTVWLVQDNADDTLLLTSSDASKQPNEVADALAQGPLAGSTFVVLPLEVGWQNWTLTVSRAGASFVKGPAAISAELQTAIANSPPVISQVDTSSVSIPIGYGETKQTTWQPWFNPDSVVIQVQPTPAGSPSTSPPDITALVGKAGFIVGDGFLNNVFSNEHKGRLYGSRGAQASYHVQDIQFVAQAGKLIISGRYVEQPPPATVRVQAELTGVDLEPSKIGVQDINCASLPTPDCNKLKLQISTATVVLTSKIQPGTKIRPPDEQALGNFFIGSKAINGIARADQIQSVNGAVVLIGPVRLRGGLVQ